MQAEQTRQLLFLIQKYQGIFLLQHMFTIGI
jgi:hypothetical protein